MTISAPQLEIAVLILGILLLFFELFLPGFEKRLIAYAGIVGLGIVLVASFHLEPSPAGQLGGLWKFYTADPLAIFFKRFALVTTISVLLMMLDYVRKSGLTAVGEFFALPVFTCAGLMYMASAIDFVSIFVSLELVTISFYVLVAFNRSDPIALEAGVKYFVLSALSTGFLIYGIAWIFGVTGLTNLDQISDAFRGGAVDRGAATFGAVLVMVALGFKIAAVPFQLWVPDVYQGAPTPVTAFLSVGSKAAGFVVLLRVLRPFMMLPHVDRLIVLLAVLTLVYGNLAALPQANLKRLLAYSSIAHAGYLLVGVACLDGRAVSFYLAAYLLMTLLSFAVLIVVAQQTGERVSDFDGLAARSPFLAFAMLVAMVSLAGLPFTAGFFGKFLIFSSALAHGQILLVCVGVMTVACGFYYYFKVIRAMYWNASEQKQSVPISLPSRVLMTALIIAIIGLGIYPRPIVNAFELRPDAVTAAAALK
jgi:NADH-quinone oxidoreductase subunit N